MGHLFFINDSFEIGKIDSSKRDVVFASFCKAMNAAKNDKDNLYATEDIHTRKYSFGTLVNDFFYKSWNEIIKDPNLVGISNTVHSLNISLLFAIPSMVQTIDSQVEFDTKFQNLHKGYTGFDIGEDKSPPFICCYNSWQEWKCKWFSINQNKIVWNNGINDFLPNKSFSDNLLIKELEKNNKLSELKKYNNDCAITFHEEVMRKKGNEIEAYTIEVGGMIAEANYYKYEEQLSKEEKKNSGSLRTIYSLMGRNGKLQYISLDHKHGMFEFHDHTGKHLGECKFDGSYTSEAQDDHNLRTL